MTYKTREGLEREILSQFLFVALDIDDAARPKLRDVVPYSAKKLESLTAKYLSRSPEFTAKRRPQWWNVTNREPKYPAWTNKKTQAPCLPFESGKNVLPGMEAFAAEVQS
jgi:hypothetical protein